MKRRNFLASSLAVTAMGGSNASGGGGGAAPGRREYYELRRYRLRAGPQEQLAENFFRQAALPAWNRAGIAPVGIFETTIGPDSPAIYVLIPYPTLDSLAALPRALQADAEFLRLGAAFLNAPATDPAYVRSESSLMVAFEGMPKLEVPPAAKEHGERIFELRTYESHSKKANRKKIEMFNNGEIAIFRRTGLRPVFFGETLIGSKLPNLTYMLTFANMQEREKNWGTFVADSEWKKLSSTPGYTDGEIVSNISNLFLTPLPYSQV